MCSPLDEMVIHGAMYFVLSFLLRQLITTRTELKKVTTIKFTGLRDGGMGSRRGSGLFV